MDVMLYGRLADPSGPRLTVDVSEGMSVSQLRIMLGRQHPELGPDLANLSVRACVKDVMVAETAQLHPDDTVEFFPPLSGG